MATLHASRFTLHPSRHAFTLLELAIVLVVVGLLVGAVVAGQSLIRRAELQDVMAQAGRYGEAVRSFTEQYGQPPGDFGRAASVWSACTNIAGTPTNTCSGNGDGHIRGWGASSDRYESGRAWQHLALSGQIPGSFSGATGFSGNYPLVAAGSSPFAEEVTGMGWIFAQQYDDSVFFHPGDTTYTAYHLLQFVSDTNTGGGTLTAAEVQARDAKFDDGSPGNGLVMTARARSCGGSAACATATDCVTSGTAGTAAYNAASTNTSCGIYFLVQRGK